MHFTSALQIQRREFLDFAEKAEFGESRDFCEDRTCGWQVLLPDSYPPQSELGMSLMRFVQETGALDVAGSAAPF